MGDKNTNEGYVLSNQLPEATDYDIKNGKVLIVAPGATKPVKQASALLMKGDKGDKITLQDLTPSEIETLQQPALEAAEKAETATKNAEKAIADADEAEKLRADAEKLRAEAEEQRALDELNRDKAETLRIEDEELRTLFESERIESEEARAKSELERIEAEKQRQIDTTDAIENAMTATDNAQNAADRSNALSDHRDEIRDGYWWRWNETTKEWYNTGEIAKGNVMFATFELNPVTGELSMNTDEEYTGANFALENGMLTVEI